MHFHNWSKLLQAWNIEKQTPRKQILTSYISRLPVIQPSPRRQHLKYIIMYLIKETAWKGNYRSTDNIKNKKRKRKLLPKKKRSPGERHTQTQKLNWTLIDLTERNASHIIPSYYHLSVSYRSLVDWCGCPLKAVSHRFNFFITII